MANLVVAVTDHPFPDLEPAREVLAPLGAEMRIAASVGAADVLAVAQHADAVINTYAQLPAELIDRFERCRIIARTGIGIDTVDLAAATAKGIVVTNVPEYCEDEVSDHAMALLLALARNVTRGNALVHGGGWALAEIKPIYRVRGRTLGLVGFGKIARLMAAKAQGFGLRVVASDPYVERADADALGVELTTFEDMLARADFVSVHAPLTPATRNLIGAEALAMMRPEAVVINTARGGLVDVAALAAALDRGAIAGAGLDVLPEEPPAADLALYGRPNVILTPHTAFYSEESVLDLQVKAAQQVALVLSGRDPVYPVTL